MPTSPRPSAEAGFKLANQRFHLIGIGGCGMSGLARMLASRGAIVTGTDNAPSPVTASLKAFNAPTPISVATEQGPGALPDDIDLVIASAAIRPDHPELMAATERGIETITYAEALGRCMLGTTAVAVAGTHGKSTTVALLGHTLRATGLDPTVIVGANCPQVDPAASPPGGFRLGAERIPKGPLADQPGLLLAEACEFNRSFHNHNPTIAAITGVEADHLDIYGTLDAVVEAFAQFAQRLPSADHGGRLLIAHEGAHRREVTAGLECEVATIGFSPDADYTVAYDLDSRRVTVTGADLDTPLTMTLWAPGVHMAMNAAFAAVLATWCGAEPHSIGIAVSEFRGLSRRMEHIATLPIDPTRPQRGEVTIFDDYGHHPTEVEATLRALRDGALHPEGRLICVFQPHQHSRTRFLLEEFAQSFSTADIVIVPHIYFVRDSEIEKTKVSAADLVDRLRSRSVRAMHLYPFEAIVEQLQNIAQDKDLIVVMGAGPVGSIAHDLAHACQGESAQQ